MTFQISPLILLNLQPMIEFELVMDSLPIQHVGNSTLPSSSGKLLLSSLYHVPFISKILVSVQKLCSDNSVFLEFNSSCFYVKDCRTKKILLRGPTRNDMYKFPSQFSSPLAYISECASLSQWHNRFGHSSMQTVQKIISTLCLPVKPSSSSSGLCSACCKAKLHQLPSSSATSHSTKPLQLIFSDVWGPAPVLSRGGFRYYVSFLDDYSRFT